MRKITSSMENPLDTVILDYCDPLLEPLAKMGVTPNMITLFGMCVRIWSIWSLFRGDKVSFLIGAILGYYCDCLDGHFARKYNMITVVGDLLDHFSDAMFQLGIVYYLVSSSTLKDSCMIWPIMIVYALFLFGTMIHVGCTQKQYNGSQMETLDMLKVFCLDKEWIYFTRFFGPATFMFVSIVLATIF